MKRLVIDTDSGVDDAHAIMLAFAHPEAQVEAITNVAGNVSLERTTVAATKSNGGSIRRRSAQYRWVANKEST